jgi:8-oxo-dGTP pyrophosphatase MutT (NUDIX family)
MDAPRKEPTPRPAARGLEVREMTREWLAGRLAQGVPHGALLEGDHGGSVIPDLTPAAVLVPIVNRVHGMTVLLTQRTAHLSDHAGQVSFPGGRAEAADGSLVATALRETREEVGIERHRIEVLGQLPVYTTRTGYRVTPVVGLLQPPFEVVPDAYEVAEVFEVPLAFLLDPANHQRHSRMHEGVMRHFWAMPYANYYIWGATAGMLRNLYRCLVDELD